MNRPTVFGVDPQAELTREIAPEDFEDVTLLDHGREFTITRLFVMAACIDCQRDVRLHKFADNLSRVGGTAIRELCSGSWVQPAQTGIFIQDVFYRRPETLVS